MYYNQCGIYANVEKSFVDVTRGTPGERFMMGTRCAGHVDSLSPLEVTKRKAAREEG